MDRTALKEAILQILHEQEEDITADEIYVELDRRVARGRTQEQIRKLIRELANDSEHLVGSSSNGFFKIRTKTDAERAIHYLTSRIPDLQRRANQIASKWNDENPNNQIER